MLNYLKSDQSPGYVYIVHITGGRGCPQEFNPYPCHRGLKQVTFCWHGHHPKIGITNFGGILHIIALVYV
jgi:hypothetical protein